MPDEKKGTDTKPGVIAVTIEEPKTQHQKPPDVDDVRAQLNAGAGFLGKVFGDKKRKETKEEEDDKKDDKTEPEDERDHEKEEEARRSEEDARAAAVLDVKPAKVKKAQKQPKPEGFSIEDATRVASEAAAKAVREVTAPKPPKEESRQDQAPLDSEYPEEYVDDARHFEYLAITKPDKYKNLKKQVLAFSKKQQDYISKWEEENQAEYDPNDEAHDEFFERNFPDIDPADYEEAKKAIKKAEVAIETKKVVQEEVRPYKEALENERRKSVMAQLAPEIETHERGMIKAVFDVVAPELGEWDTTDQKLQEVVKENPLQSRFVNDVVTPAANMLQTYYRWMAGAEGYDERNPLHRALYASLDRLERFISSRPEDEITRDGKRFNRWDEIHKLPAEQRDGYWGIGPREVAQWLRSEVVNHARKRWENEAEALDKYVARKSGNGRVTKSAQNGDEGGDRRRMLNTNIVTADDDSGGGGHVNLDAGGKAQPSTLGFSGFMRGLGFGKTGK